MPQSRLWKPLQVCVPGVRAGRLKVAITVDCEPDRLTLDYAGIERLEENLHIFSDRRVRGTFFVTPDVAEKYSGILDRISGDGSEVGVHLHPEQMVKDRRPAKVYLHEYPIASQRNLIEDALIPFEKYRPVSFRAGRLGANAETVRLLDDLGFDYDSSVYPYSVFSDGADAYYPVVEGRRLGILEVPVTCQSRALMGVSRRLGWSFHDRLRDVLVFSPLLIKKAGKSGLSYLKIQYRKARSEHRLLVFLMHSWDFLDADFASNLDNFLRFIASRGDEFIPMKEIEGLGFGRPSTMIDGRESA